VSGVDGAGLDVLNLVDIRDESNYELAMRLQTSIANEDREFYTDLNGFQASQLSISCLLIHVHLPRLSGSQWSLKAIQENLWILLEQFFQLDALSVTKPTV